MLPLTRTSCWPPAFERPRVLRAGAETVVVFEILRLLGVPFFSR